MITKLSIELENPNKLIDIKSSSLFHGFLMEQIDYEYGKILHQNGWKPYTSSIVQKENSLVWEITTLNLQAKMEIIDRILSKNLNTIYLSHKKLNLNIISKEQKEISYDSLLKKYYDTKGARYLIIHFQTPTAFKSAGKYVFLPDIRFIYQSVMNKYDTVSEEYYIFNEELLEEMVSCTQLLDYHLKSQRFHLEGVTIPSFTGKMKIKIHGSQKLVNLINFLMQFGTYSGIGIKTAIGMGKISVMSLEK